MRLFTRADLDGIVSAAMIMEKEKVSEVVFAHPKDMQDGLIDVRDGDAISNLPFHPKAKLWFDHHDKAEKVVELPPDVRGRVDVARSAARLVYEFYDTVLPESHADMLDETDRLDSADLKLEDVLNPSGWILLGFTLDPRTGLGGFQEYAMHVIDAIRQKKSIDEILEMPAVMGRINRYSLDEELFRNELLHKTRVEGNVSITDFSKLEKTPTGNRFLVFALFRDCDINVRIYRHRDKSKIVVAVGKCIFNRSHPVHVGRLMSEYGGGGVPGAGTCPLSTKNADEKIKVIIDRLKH